MVSCDSCCFARQAQAHEGKQDKEQKSGAPRGRPTAHRGQQDSLPSHSSVTSLLFIHFLGLGDVSSPTGSGSLKKAAVRRSWCVSEAPSLRRAAFWILPLSMLVGLGRRTFL